MQQPLAYQHDPDSWDWSTSSYQQHLENGLRNMWGVLYHLMHIGESILEVGCGSGKTSVLAKMLSPRKRVAALDASAGACQHTMELAKYAGVDVEVHQADALTLPFRDQEFGIAFSVGVLEHYPDEWIIKAIKEQMRVAEAVLVNVPLPSYGQSFRSHGDERWLPKTYWLGLFSEAGPIVDVSLHGDVTEETIIQVIIDSKARSI